MNTLREKESKCSHLVMRNLDEIVEEGRWENNTNLVEHLIHNVLDQTKVDVISAARIPEAKADDMNIMMVVALSNCILGGIAKGSI